jgi:hypothetical protein
MAAESNQADAPPTSGASAPNPPPEPAAATTAVPPAIPLKRRNCEISTRLLRLPESDLRRIGLAIAEDGSSGISQVMSRTALNRLMAQAHAITGAELRPIPSLICQSGTHASAQVGREFPYPDNWTPAKSGMLVPSRIDNTNLGFALEADATLKSDHATDLHFTAEFARLLGFADADGKLVKPLPPPKAADWFQRLTACEMPVGIGGNPSFLVQRSESRFELTTENAALVFGFRDAELAAASGGKNGDHLVNYLAVQVEVLP